MDDIWRKFCFVAHSMPGATEQDFQELPVPFVKWCSDASGTVCLIFFLFALSHMYDVRKVNDHLLLARYVSVYRTTISVQRALKLFRPLHKIFLGNVSAAARLRRNRSCR